MVPISRYEDDMKLGEPVRSRLAEAYRILNDAKTRLRERAAAKRVDISFYMRALNTAFQIARSGIIAGSDKKQTNFLFDLYKTEMMMRFGISSSVKKLLNREELAKQIAVELFGVLS